MLWEIIALSVGVIYAISNLIDKYVLTKWISDPLAPSLMTAAMCVILAISIFAFKGIEPVSFVSVVFMLGLGVLSYLSYLLYFMATKVEDISRIVPFMFLSPLFILLLAHFFIGEALQPLDYVGIILMVAGAVLISLTKFKIKLSKGLIYILVMDLLLSVISVASKYLLGTYDFWTLFAYMRLGFVFALPFLLYLSLNALRASVKKHGKRVLVAMVSSEVLGQVGAFLLLIATSLASVTLVNTFSSTQPFFVLLFVVIIGLFYPKILKEDLRKSTVLLKIAATALVVIGGLLIVG